MGFVLHTVLVIREQPTIIGFRATDDMRSISKEAELEHITNNP